MRKIIKLALVGLLSVSTIVVAAESSPEALRIGYQKGSIGCWQELFCSCKEASPCLHSLCSFW